MMQNSFKSPREARDIRMNLLFSGKHDDFVLLFHVDFHLTFCGTTNSIRSKWRMFEKKYLAAEKHKNVNLRSHTKVIENTPQKHDLVELRGLPSFDVLMSNMQLGPTKGGHLFPWEKRTQSGRYIMSWLGQAICKLRDISVQEQ
jgi:hypothetical protein